MKFILQRHRGLNWEFYPVGDEYGKIEYLMYQTRYGNIYKIFTDDMFKPIWIGRFLDGKWLNWEHDVRPSILLAYDDNNELMWKYSWQ